MTKTAQHSKAVKEKTGYKKTKLGWIPEEWEVSKIGSGKDYKHLSEGDIPVIGTGGIMTYVNDCLFDGESVGIGRKGTIDKPQFLNGKFWTVDTLFYTHSFENTLPRYVYYLFLTINWYKFNEASGVPSLSKNTIEKIPIALPPLPEQQKIAAILSKCDEQIAMQTQLIHAKEQQKKGLMQQLLTGEVRFDGFDEEWEEVTLGEVFEKIIGGGTPSRHNSSFWGNEIPWCTVKDFTDFNPNQTQEMITSDGLLNSSANLIPMGTIIIPTRMALGKVAIFNVDVAINQDLKALFLNQKIERDFLYHWLLFNAENINLLGTGSTVKGITLDVLRSLQISIPQNIIEQQKIASVLSAADEEIALLKKELSAMQEQKKGLMQVLLTGEVRVPNNKN